MAEPIRVLVVDDSAYSRKTISDILESTGMCRVIGAGRDGEDGVKKALELKPDLITLDLEMPKMDGFTFLRILMKSLPTPVLVISSMVHRKLVFRAMEMGAIDFLAKPDPTLNADLYDIKEELSNKIKVVGQLQMLNIQRRLRKPTVEELADVSVAPTRHVKEKSLAGRFDFVAIGSSTGGPSALQEVLSSLPGDLPVGVGVSQHMPAGFTRAFADRLNKYSEWYIKEADDNEPVIRGKALIAPGGHHLAFERSNNEVRARVLKRHAGDKNVPSVDKLFVSAAEAYGPRLLGVVLTGMGNDGTAGAVEIKKRGGMIITESAETAIVYGMPREVNECGASDCCVPLDMVAKEITKAVAVKRDVGASNVGKSDLSRKR